MTNTDISLSPEEQRQDDTMGGIGAYESRAQREERKRLVIRQLIEEAKASVAPVEAAAEERQPLGPNSPTLGAYRNKTPS